MNILKNLAGRRKRPGRKLLSWAVRALLVWSIGLALAVSQATAGNLIDPYKFLSEVTTPPAFVNAGTALNNGTATSATPALPGSLVNGNIVLCAAVSRSTGTHATSSSGWSGNILGDAVGGSGGTQTRLGLFWRIVDGSEAAPTITGMGGSNIAQCFQFSGTKASPVGNGDTGGGTSTGQTASDSGINSSANYSRVVYVIATRGGTVSQPSGYTEDNDSGSVNGCGIAIGGVNITTSGSASGAISATFTATNNSAWAVATLELKAN